MAAHALNGLSLCAGAGMLDLGIAIAEPGYRTVCYVEREVYAAATLVARMEDEALCEAPVWDDLTTFDGGSWRGVVDIVVAGFPCPPASVAGQRKGVEDDRWIWPDIARIVRDVGPGWVFLENVRGLLSVNAGWAFHQVLRDLACLGFDIEWGVLGARDVGATHRRERLFVLAHAKGERWREPQHEERTEPWRDARQDACRRGDELAHTGSDTGRQVTGHRGVDGSQNAGVDTRAALVRSGGTLADAGDRQFPKPGRRSPGRDGLGPAGAALGNASGGPAQLRGDARQLRDEVGTVGGGGDSAARREPGPAGATLADAEHGGCVEPDVHPGQRRSGQGTVVACWSELGLPHSPPGPGDSEGWRAVLEDAPHLEPAVCRMADGMAGRLDPRARAYEFVVPTPDEYIRHALAFRVDRLRLCGNGVHPLAAAYAFHALRTRFGG